MKISNQWVQDEKALLLCSLLLGFGVDALVACGSHKSTASGTRLWVVTRPNKQEILFWDPVSGAPSTHVRKATWQPSIENYEGSFGANVKYIV